MSPARPGRRRAIVCAAAVAAMGIGGLLARSTSGSTFSTGDGPPATEPPPTVVASSDSARPSDPVRAAIRAAAAPQAWLYFDDADIRSSVHDLATEAAAPALAELAVADIGAARADLASSPGPVWWIVHPLAVRVIESTSTTAEVEVWTVTVLSAVEIAAPQAEWLTVTVGLSLEAGEWRVETIRDRPGPSPMLGPHDQPWDAGPFAAGLDGFERLDGGRLLGEVPA